MNFKLKYMIPIKNFKIQIKTFKFQIKMSKVQNILKFLYKKYNHKCNNNIVEHTENNVQASYLTL